jgi:hypothetical protein
MHFSENLTFAPLRITDTYFSSNIFKKTRYIHICHYKKTVAHARLSLSCDTTLLNNESASFYIKDNLTLALTRTMYSR